MNKNDLYVEPVKGRTIVRPSISRDTVVYIAYSHNNVEVVMSNLVTRLSDDIKVIRRCMPSP